jgi:hypothetical protein
LEGEIGTERESERRESILETVYFHTLMFVVFKREKKEREKKRETILGRACCKTLMFCILT